MKYCSAIVAKRSLVNLDSLSLKFIILYFIPYLNATPRHANSNNFKNQLKLRNQKCKLNKNILLDLFDADK